MKHTVDFQFLIVEVLSYLSHMKNDNFKLFTAETYY